MTINSSDPRVQRTRMAFQKALLELLQTHPFEDIRISQIAAQATFSRNAFYAHFESKEALLFSYIDDIMEEILDSAYADYNASKDIDLTLHVKKVFDLWRKNAQALQYVMQVAKKDLVIMKFRKYAAAFMNMYNKDGTPLDQLPFGEYILDFSTGGWFMLIKRWSEDGMRIDSETMARLLTDITPKHRLMAAAG